MLLENDLYPQDVRVRYEAESLAANGYTVCVIAPRGQGQRNREHVAGVEVRRFWLPLEHAGRPRDDLLPGLRTVPFERKAVIACRLIEDRVEITNLFYGGRDYEALYRRNEPPD